MIRAIIWVWRVTTIAFKWGRFIGSNNLVLKIIGDSSITVENCFEHLQSSTARTFSDGKHYGDLQSVKRFMVRHSSDAFNGMAGNDTFLPVEGGNDAYLFSKGDGNIIIRVAFTTLETGPGTVEVSRQWPCNRGGGPHSGNRYTRDRRPVDK